MIVVYLIEAPADIIPDYEGNLLHVNLHHLSTPVHNRAAKQIAELLNESQTVLPGADLVLLKLQVTKGQVL